MKTLMRALTGLALVGALILALGVQSSGGSTSSTTAGCEVPDYLASHAPGPRTTAGFFEYQAWIATDSSQATLDRVQSLLKSYFRLPEDYGDLDQLRGGLIGIALDHAAQTVNVVVDPALVDVSDLSSRATAALDRPAFKVAVIAGCSSASDLAEARTFLDGLGMKFAPHFWGYYLDAHDSTYHVTFSPRDKAAAAKVARRLGDRVTLEFEDTVLLDRLNDGEPHWGGAGIRPGSYNNNICTSAFTVRLPSGNRGSVTAGHCFDDGALNGRNVFSGNRDYGGETAGAHDYPNYDMVRIGNGNQTWDNRIHVDPCCPVVRNVVASGNPDVGDSICNSGMTTRAICGLEVLAIDEAAGGRLHLIRARRGGDIVVRGGDSGGPMYNRFGDTNAAARGMIVLGSGGPNCLTEKRCTTVYGHRISAVVNHLNVTVSTG
jgi:hypothetical protein